METIHATYRSKSGILPYGKRLLGRIRITGLVIISIKGFTIGR